MVHSYLRWVRFERPACLFVDIEADGSREMLHAWEIVDTEFKIHQDREADRRAKEGTAAVDWEDEGEAETGSRVSRGDRVETDANGFPKLKGNYTPIG